MIEIKTTGNITQEEVQNYVDYLQGKYNRKLVSLEIKIDGDFAELNYQFEHKPFERIRRITGYLTGDVKGWNNAKTAELRDRVKHGANDSVEELQRR